MAHLDRKALGQHFLKNQQVIKKIVTSFFKLTEQYQCAQILEIGLGRGALTHPILDWVQHHKPTNLKQLVLIEKDLKLEPLWNSKLEQFKKNLPQNLEVNLEVNLEIKMIRDDFLKMPPHQWIENPPVAVISNLPYSVSIPILKTLLKEQNSIPFMVLMFQEEVAQRIRAQPKTKQRGSLSLWVQNQWKVEKLLRVSPRDFNPPPEVYSEVIILERRNQPLVPLSKSYPKEWENLLKKGFSQRRKMLRSVLGSDLLEQAEVDGRKRAEALEIEEWAKIFTCLIRKNDRT